MSVLCEQWNLAPVPCDALLRTAPRRPVWCRSLAECGVASWNIAGPAVFDLVSLCQFRKLSGIEIEEHTTQWSKCRGKAEPLLTSLDHNSAQQKKSGPIANTKLAENSQDLRRVAPPGTRHHLAPWSIGCGSSWHCGQAGYLDGSPRQQSVRTLWQRKPTVPLIKHWLSLSSNA